MQKMIDTQKNEVVTKSNKLIEASYRLTLVEQQIILYAICRAREEQKGLSPEIPVTIDAIQFGLQFNIDSKNVYRQLKIATDTLYERSVTIHTLDQEKGELVTKTRWISEQTYIDGCGQVQLIFSPRIIPFITRLETQFTSFGLAEIAKLTSSHAIRLYELLAQYSSVGKREVEIEWLKERLDIASEYPRIDNLKRRVIDIAVQQINSHAGILTSYLQKKTGRSVTHFIFKIKSKENKKAALKKANPESSKPTHASHIETPTPKKSTRSVMPDGLADNLKNMLR